MNFTPISSDEIIGDEESIILNLVIHFHTLTPLAYNRHIELHCIGEYSIYMENHIAYTIPRPVPE